MSEKVQFRHQTTGTKNKPIDRVYIKVLDRRIQDRMDKMTMNRPQVSLERGISSFLIDCFWSASHVVQLCFNMVYLFYGS